MSPRRILCAHADSGGEGAHWKVPGEPCTVSEDRPPHQWVVLVTYEVSDVEIEAFKAGLGMHLDDRRRVGLAGPGCRACEQVYNTASRSTPCPGEP